MFWYLQVLKKYVDFSGRARLKEYWIFFLVNSVVVNIIFAVGFGLPQAFGVSGAVLLALAGLSFACAVALSLPGLALAVRRLHDTNHSGWLLLVALVPLIGGIVLLVWLCRGGDAGRNQYGPDPKQDPESEAAVASGEAPQTATGKKVRRVLSLAYVTIVAVTTGGFLYAVNRGVEEARVLAPCTGISASAEEVANLDLAALGLRSTGKQDARSTYGEGFVDGAVIQYSAGRNPAAIVAALRYSSSTDAATIFSGMQEWAQGNCGRSSWASAGASGVIHCDLRDGHDLFLWKDNWILDIEAADLGGVPGAELADQIKDAILAHWLELGNASGLANS